MGSVDKKTFQWVVKSQLKNSKGQRFEWREHEFLIDPLIDWHPRQGMNKASQLGASESIGILKALYATKVLKYNVIYTLPTDTFLSNFVPPRVDSIIENNKHILGDIVGGVTQKRVGSGDDQRFLYFMGAHNPRGENSKEESSRGVSVTSDLNIHDEASRSDQFTLNQMRSRLDNSLYKGRWLFDNPTYPLMGADAIYQKSDQRHWIITCGHCGYRQYVEWARLDKVDYQSGSTHTYVDTERNTYICGKCRLNISDYDRMTGEWVAKFPSRDDYRGYWMPKMVYVRHDVKSLLELEEDETVHKSIFYNFSLAKPYLGSDVKLSREIILENRDGNENIMRNNAMGVDQGNVKWYVIGNETGIFKVGHTKSWDEIERLMKLYNCATVSDALPYQRYPKKFAEKYKRFWRAFYKPEADQRELAKFGTKSDSKVVLIKREEMFDVIVDRFVDNDFPIQCSIDELEVDFIKHWESLVRIIQEDSQGNQRFKWVSVNGEDHLAHATLYFTVAMMKAKIGRATIASISKKDTKKRTGVEIIDRSMPQDVINDLTKNFTKRRK